MELYRTHTRYLTSVMTGTTALYLKSTSLLSNMLTGGLWARIYASESGWDLGFTTAASERETDGEIKEREQQEGGMDKQMVMVVAFESVEEVNSSKKHTLSLHFYISYILEYRYKYPTSIINASSKHLI